MPKIQFHEYAQKIRPRRVRIGGTQEEFMTQFFHNAGMANIGESKTKIKLTYDDEYLKKIYTGKRLFNRGIKSNFIDGINRTKLVHFFQEHFGKANLLDAMLRFDIPESLPILNDSFFYEALCTQLEYLIAVMEVAAEDIVASEYIRLYQESEPQALHSANGHLLNDLDKLGLIIDKIRDLSKLLEGFDFESGDSPVHALFASIKNINADLPPVEIKHKATAQAVKAFHDQQEDFMQFLSNVTTAHDYRAYSHSGTSQTTRKDVIYTMNTVQSMRKSLYSTINKIFHAENTLKEEIMFLEGYVPLDRVYGKTRTGTDVSE